AGDAPTSQHLLRTCPTLEQIVKSGPGGPTPSFHACLEKLSATFHTVVTYQPANRFWAFQWAEMGIFLAAALALCGLSYWWLGRRYA
ncbi:MAG: hypothetical protein ACRDXC_01565, partial [Acidimicrobiales bacterium]